MKIIACVFAVMFCGAVQAADVNQYEACVEYLNSNTVVRPLVDYAFQNTERGIEFAFWNLPTPRPTFAQMDAVMPQALAWKANKVAEETADIDKMEPKLKAVVKALVRIVNLRLPADKKITEEELRAAIKAEAAK